ncbi:MAG TPA: hypothetical protein DCZ76_03445 [Treponema sp.]|nr:hypothetical protein [Treponema sp.]
MLYNIGHLWKVRCALYSEKEISKETIKEFRNLNEFVKLEDFDCFENISFGPEDKHSKKLSFVCDLVIDSCDEEEIQYIIDDYFHFSWKNIYFHGGKVEYYEEL